MIFLRQNAIYVSFALVALIGFVLYLYVIRKASLPRKQRPDRGAFFSKRDYEDYKEDGEKVLNNTTMSFKPGEALDCSVDGLYSRTMLAGTKIIQQGAFSIAKVGDI